MIFFIIAFTLGIAYVTVAPVKKSKAPQDESVEILKPAKPRETLPGETK